MFYISVTCLWSWLGRKAFLSFHRFTCIMAIILFSCSIILYFIFASLSSFYKRLHSFYCLFLIFFLFTDNEINSHSPVYLPTYGDTEKCCDSNMFYSTEFPFTLWNLFSYVSILKVYVHYCIYVYSSCQLRWSLYMYSNVQNAYTCCLLTHIRQYELILPILCQNV